MRRLLSLSIASVLIVSACGTAAAPAPSSAPASASAATVDYQGFKAQPATLEVAKGTKVTWSNKDSTAHTVTSGTNRQADGKFDGQVGAGETFSFTFNDAGTFEYFCGKHSSMVGFVVYRLQQPREFLAGSARQWLWWTHVILLLLPCHSYSFDRNFV